MKKKLQDLSTFCCAGLLVRLRPFNIQTDLDLVMNWVNDPDVTRFLKIKPPLSREEEVKYFQNTLASDTTVLFAIETLGGDYIGNMGIHGINWKTRKGGTGSMIGNKAFWGKGYGADAKMLVLHHAFYTLGLHRISSSVVSFNGRSAGCLEKTGYIHEGVERKDIFVDGEYYDRIKYGILEEEFKAIWPGYKEIIEQASKLSKEGTASLAMEFFKTVREKNREKTN